jgi:hypothetical protein
MLRTDRDPHFATEIENLIPNNSSWLIRADDYKPGSLQIKALVMRVSPHNS